MSLTSDVVVKMGRAGRRKKGEAMTCGKEGDWRRGNGGRWGKGEVVPYRKYKKVVYTNYAHYKKIEEIKKKDHNTPNLTVLKLIELI